MMMYESCPKNVWVWGFKIVAGMKPTLGKGKLGMKTYLGKNFPRSGPRPLLKWWAGPQGEGARPQGELIGKEEIGSNDATGSLVP